MKITMATTMIVMMKIILTINKQRMIIMIVITSITIT